MDRTLQTVSVDAYLVEGCGRCDHFRTPECKVHRWTAELVALRALVLGTGLREEMKWGNPCYTLDGGNVLMVAAFKEFACLSFFKGALLPDPAGLLEAPGPNSQAARLVKFTSSAAVEQHREAAVALVRAAIEVERSGAKVEFARSPEPVPEELQARLDADPTLQAAFAALSPGRQRSHILHVSGAKTPAARQSRAGKCVEKILQGKGFLDR